MSEAIFIGETLGQRIKRLRAEKHMKTSELASLTRLPLSSLKDWQADRAKPRDLSMTRLANGLDVTTFYLRTGRHDSTDLQAAVRLYNLKAAINRAIIARKSLSDIQRIVADA